MKVHFIAIGGSVMHQLAIALKLKGNNVTGSDDEIFEPAKTNLEKAGIMPASTGWFPENITAAIDAVILGMHAKEDNPELLKAEKLGLELISPSDDWLIHLEHDWLKRKVRSRTLGMLKEHDFPVFAKPQVPKIFRSGIYESLTDFRLECQGLTLETPIIISEIVQIKAEARVFVLDAKIQTFALYEGFDESSLLDFANQFVEHNKLPLTCVLDFALLDDLGWAFLEANPTWGAGLNNCNPLGAARCIAQATLSNT